MVLPQAAWNLLQDHRWPGNMRELEQCVRSVLLRGRYEASSARSEPVADTLEQMRRGALSADEVLEFYCTLLYAQEGSYEGAARRLGIDRRTVRRKVNAERAAQFMGDNS